VLKERISKGSDLCKEERVTGYLRGKVNLISFICFFLNCVLLAHDVKYSSEMTKYQCPLNTKKIWIFGNALGSVTLRHELHA